jgi:cytosine/uracil/thiamine/allantoin permease
MDSPTPTNNQVTDQGNRTGKSIFKIYVEESLYGLVAGAVVVPVGVIPPLLADHFFPGISQFWLGATILLSITLGVALALLVIRYLQKNQPRSHEPKA